MHSCVNCGQAYYCHGDIDDCEVESPDYAEDNCTGCGAADCNVGGLDGFADVEDLLPASLESVVTSYLQEVEARSRQIEMESAGQMRLLP